MTLLEAAPGDPAVGEHGTRAHYRAGCKCVDCKAANALATAESRRSPRTYVPAGKVRTHLTELVDCGLSLREIARLAGVDRETARGIFAGKYPRCTVETKRRILGVLPPRQESYISVTSDEEDQPDEPPVDVLASLRLLVDSPADLAWKADGDCGRLSIPVQRVQEWFFPERGQSTRPALAVCAGCRVWADCLAFAIETNAEGIWGRSAGNHRRKLVHLAITVTELADAGMADDPDLSMPDAIARVLDARQAVA